MQWIEIVLFLFCSAFISAAKDHPTLRFLILAQKYAWNEKRALRLEQDLISQSQDLGLKSVPVVQISSRDFNVMGDWAFWPLVQQLVITSRKESSIADWLVLCEEDTEIHLSRLFDYLANKDPSVPQYFGHGLFDKASTIIHHYAFAGDDNSRFLFPDFAGGVVFSWSTIQWLYEKLQSDERRSDFTIDAKHELAMMLYDKGSGIEMTNAPELCTLADSLSCVTVYRPDLSDCKKEVPLDEILFAVKTYHENYKTRGGYVYPIKMVNVLERQAYMYIVVVLKRTWGLQARKIEYYSDTEDMYIPTVDLGVENTERGHCGKTEKILKMFLEKWKGLSWLVIADDDTLFSVPRLKNLLSCYDSELLVILGQRYGYGFNKEGDRGYEYPTGGSGMIFSKGAVEALVKECKCPQIDSPDDMILGMCARHLKIPILHSAALHQARPEDYAEDYLKRLPPISFHKHWEVDPYKVFTDWLKDQTPPTHNDHSADRKSVHEHLEL